MSDRNDRLLTNLSHTRFSRSFNWLIIMARVIPSLFGLIFIGFIQVLTVDQVIGIMLTPVEPAFNILWLVFAYGYFSRFIRPVAAYDELLRQLS